MHYGIVSEAQVHRLSVMPIRRVIFGAAGANPAVREFGVGSSRLGTCERTKPCASCGEPIESCVGHFGQITLSMPVFHIGFFATTLRIVRTVCKRCSHILLTAEEVTYYQQKLKNPRLSALQRAAIAKNVAEDAAKTRVCDVCGAMNGSVKRVRPLRLVHEKYRAALRKTDETLDTQELFLASLRHARDSNPDIAAVQRSANEELTPLRVREIFQAIPSDEVPLFGMKPGARPEDLLISSLAVVPVPIRPSAPTAFGPMREDDLTTLYSDILAASNMLDEERVGTMEAAKISETWDVLQLRVAKLLDGSLPGFPRQAKGVTTRSFSQRLKGKHGRFRGNLSGKRVNFSGRSVISPDPNLGIDEVAVPLRMARVLTYPQKVFSGNIDLMRRLVLNGPDVHPGACFVVLKETGQRKNLRFDREVVAARLALGDVVERHVMDGDLILFNRQPSLHRISMMCHRAHILPFRTLRFNVCCCTPYNADFDGDEMNIHLVQTEEARAEAKQLMASTKNVITAKNGEPIIACIQDFLTAAYLVTARDVFLDRCGFCQAVSHWLGSVKFDLPRPTILRPVELWTGKQLFDVVIRPSISLPLHLSFEAATKAYQAKEKKKHWCSEEGYLSFFDSHLIAGRLDKKILGGGAKDGLFGSLAAAAGGDYTATCMSRISRLTSRWLMTMGFSLGLGDVAPTAGLEATKAEVLKNSLSICDDLIFRAACGKLDPMPGLTVESTLEAKLNEELSNIRERCGSEAIRILTPDNAPLVMALSGSKGSTLNIAQMMACVGQQTVCGKRIPNAYVARSLPHFQRYSKHPAARGFVANSFFSGLTPTEFFFHTMAGREGLVDTAVKTAETGYIYRRLMKAMEDLSLKYDMTVRNSKNDIVQLRYGDDMLDPLLMEGAHSTPINFNALWLLQHNDSSRKFNGDPLLPQQVRAEVDALLSSPEYALFSRRFVVDVRAFWEGKVSDLAQQRRRLSLPENSVCASSPEEQWVAKAYGLSKGRVHDFMEICRVKYREKVLEPGTPCGAIAAQSIGEPSTQMTLKTFHFAGIAGMSITQGVPRLAEIINATKNISTPVVRAPLLNNESRLLAQTLRGSMESIRLKEIALEMSEVVKPGIIYFRVALNRKIIKQLNLDITAEKVRKRILAVAHKPLSPLRWMLNSQNSIEVENRDVLHFYPPLSSSSSAFAQGNILFSLNRLQTLLPDIVVSGIDGVNRTILSAKGAGSHATLEIVAESAELRSVMNLPGIDGRRTKCNHVVAVERVLGIEAARSVVISEIQEIMAAYGLTIDIRHITLLADVMTHRGSVLGITRYGIQKMNNGVLTMASFERTTEQLYEAAVYQRSDKCLSVSESVIVGEPIPLGTNSFKLFYQQPPPPTTKPRKALVPPTNH